MSKNKYVIPGELTNMLGSGICSQHNLPNKRTHTGTRYNRPFYNIEDSLVGVSASPSRQTDIKYMKQTLGNNAGQHKEKEADTKLLTYWIKPTGWKGYRKNS